MMRYTVILICEETIIIEPPALWRRVLAWFRRAR